MRKKNIRKRLWMVYSMIYGEYELHYIISGNKRNQRISTIKCKNK